MGRTRFFSGVIVIVILVKVAERYLFHHRLGNNVFWTLVGVWYAICWINIVDERYRRPVFFFGKYLKTLGPGLSLLDPLLFSTQKDICVQEDTKKLEVVFTTRDNVSVTFTTLLTFGIDEYRVKDAVVGVYDVFGSTLERARITIAEAASFTFKELEEILDDRDAFGEAIKEGLSERVESWGVIVRAYELEAFKVNDPVIADAIAARARAMFDMVSAETFNKAGQAYTSDGKWYRTTELARSGGQNMFLIPAAAPAAQPAPRSATAATPVATAPKVEAVTPPTQRMLPSTPAPQAVRPTNGTHPVRVAQPQLTEDQLRFAPSAPRVASAHTTPTEPVGRQLALASQKAPVPEAPAPVTVRAGSLSARLAESRARAHA